LSLKVNLRLPGKVNYFPHISEACPAGLAKHPHPHRTSALTQIRCCPEISNTRMHAENWPVPTAQEPLVIR